MSDLVRDLEESRPDWEAECKSLTYKLGLVEEEYQSNLNRLEEIIKKQRETIINLENACFNLAVAMNRERAGYNE